MFLLNIFYAFGVYIMMATISIIVVSICAKIMTFFEKLFPKKKKSSSSYYVYSGSYYDNDDLYVYDTNRETQQRMIREQMQRDSDWAMEQATLAATPFEYGGYDTDPGMNSGIGF